MNSKEYRNLYSLLFIATARPPRIRQRHYIDGAIPEPLANQVRGQGQHPNVTGRGKASEDSVVARHKQGGDPSVRHPVPVPQQLAICPITTPPATEDLESLRGKHATVGLVGARVARGQHQAGAVTEGDDLVGQFGIVDHPRGHVVEVPEKSGGDQLTSDSVVDPVLVRFSQAVKACSVKAASSR